MLLLYYKLIFQFLFLHETLLASENFDLHHCVCGERLGEHLPVVWCSCSTVILFPAVDSQLSEFVGCHRVFLLAQCLTAIIAVATVPFLPSPLCKV